MRVGEPPSARSYSALRMKVKGPALRSPPALVSMACGQSSLRLHHSVVDADVVDQAGEEGVGGHG